MSQMPPPGYNQGYAPQGYPQGYPQSTSNPLAIVSLICGIVGCLIITPIIGIVTGLLAIGKAKPPVGGKGMAIAGILLSILWIIGGGLVYVVANKGMDAVKIELAKQVSAETMSVLNDIHADGKQPASRIPAARVTELNKQLQDLGKCTGVQLSGDFSIMEAAKSQHFTLTGTGTFEKGGSKSVTVETPRIESRGGQQSIDLTDITIK